MINPLRMAIVGSAAVIALCTSAAVGAQGVPGPSADVQSAQRDFAMDHKAGEPGGPWMRRDPAEMQKHAADHLRTLLQLSPQQEPALQTFLVAMKPSERGHHKDMAPAGGANAATDPAQRRAEMQKRHVEMARARDAERAMTTPQRLDAMMKHRAEHEAKFEAHVAAVKTFYAALTPSQQKVFDTLDAGEGRERRMNDRRPGGRMGEGGPHRLADDFDRPFGRGGPGSADAPRLSQAQPGER